MTTAARWEAKFHEQITANNLLSDKLRKTRKVAREMFEGQQAALTERADEIKSLKYTVQLMEGALLKEVSGYDADGKPK